MVNKELMDAFFEDARDVLEEWERVSLKLTPKDTVKAYEPILRCAHNLKGSAGMTGLSTLHAQMHHFEDYLVQLRDQGRAPTPNVVAILLEIEKLLRRWIEGLKNNPEHVEDCKATEEKLARLVGAPVKNENPHAEADIDHDQDEDTEETEDAEAGKVKNLAPLTANKAESAAARKADSQAKGGESLRVSVAKLDHLIQLVGEVSLHQAIIDRASREGTMNTPAIRSVIDLKTKLTQDLQDAALSLRMIPVGGLFQKVERVVRETANQLVKQVEFHRKGEEVSLDKLVVEGMLDPLIHIARNAVDHGIESGEDRIKAGKSPIGEITIAAENTAAGVTIIFADDGKGIDGEKVYKKAVDRGLIPADEPMSPAAKLQLIFIPGLSTAEKVTEFSGRGVGMDVVADTVKRMGGRVELESQIGKGTKLMITLPTNLSILDALVIKVNGCQYAIPNQDLAEVVDLREFNIQPVNGGEGHVIDLRGKVVPVEEMGSFLDNPMGIAGKNGNGQPRPGIIVHYREDRLALAVDTVVGQQQIFVRPVIGHLAPIGFYGGSTILSDGEPTIILNLPEMARRYFTSH